MAHRSVQSRQPLHRTSRAARPSLGSFVGLQTLHGSSLSQAFRYTASPTLGNGVPVVPCPRCAQLRSSLSQSCIGSLRIAAKRNMVSASVALSRRHVQRYRYGMEELYVVANVVGIYTAPTAGSTLQPVPKASLEAGKGLVGDRYYAQVGTFSKKVMLPDAEITLIESEEIDRFNLNQQVSYQPAAFRRNIVTCGIRLNELVGKRFWVGSALLEGKRLCEPCGHLAKLVSSTVVEGMVHRSGLRAQIVRGATVSIGDKIHECAV